MKKPVQEAPKSWIVKVECVVTKEIICDDCTRYQAETSPYSHAIDERELGQNDWKVLSVEPNT